MGRWLGYRRVVGESLADLTDLFKERFVEILTAHSPAVPNTGGIFGSPLPGSKYADFLGDFTKNKSFSGLTEGAYLKENAPAIGETFSDKMGMFDPSERRGFFDYSMGNLSSGLSQDDLSPQFNKALAAKIEDYPSSGNSSDDLFGYLSSMVPTTEVNAALSAEAASNTGLLSLDEDFDKVQGFYE